MAYKRGGPLIVPSKCFQLAAHMVFYAAWPIAWTVEFFLYRHSVHGRYQLKKLRKTHKKALIVSNHTTPLDPVLMCTAVWPKPIWHTLLEATVCTPFLGTLIQLLGGMPVPSGRNSVDRFLTYIDKALKERPYLHIYPEGECYIQNQEVNRFHQGAFLASMKYNLPIIPIATVFTEPKTILGWKSPRPRATLYILDPIFPDQFTNAKEYAEFARQKIQAEIYKRGGTNAYSKGHMARIEGVNG